MLEEKIVELDWWDSFEYKGVEITCTPSRHFSARWINDRDKTFWGSWAIKSYDHRIFYSSDGGWGDHFAEIGEKLGPFDLTFIEIGAWNEAWAAVHLFPEQAIAAHKAVRGKVMIPVHWGTFDLSFHTWQEPIMRAFVEAEKQNVKLITPMIGDLRKYPIRRTEEDNWWKELE